MHRPHNTNHRHLADVKATVAALERIPEFVGDKPTGFNYQSSLKSALKRVRNYYGRAGHTPHQGSREKLRRRLGGFYTLHKKGDPSEIL